MTNVGMFKLRNYAKMFLLFLSCFTTSEGGVANIISSSSMLSWHGKQSCFYDQAIPAPWAGVMQLVPELLRELQSCNAGQSQHVDCCGIN